MEELVRLTRPRLRAAARRIAGATDAEDAVRTAYHALLRKGEVPRDAPLMAWLLTAVVRVAYRHRATTRAQHEIARRLASAPRPGPAAHEDEALLRAEIEHLPALYRDAVVLHYFEGLTAAEAGQLLGLSEAAVWQRLRRARLLLRSRLSAPLKHGLLVIPWWLADRASAASLLVGGTMKGKAPAAVLVLALVGGGIAWHESRDGTTAERSTDRPARIVAEDIAPAPVEAQADRGPPAQPPLRLAPRRACVRL